MGNIILLLVIVIAIITTIVSIKEHDLRKAASVIACIGMFSCIFHYFSVVQFNKNYIGTVNSLNINQKLELFNNEKLSSDQKEQLIYSIANNLENISVSTLKPVLVDNKNNQIIDLFFKKMQERGLFFNDEQLEFLVINAIKDKSVPYRKYLFPTSLGYEKVLKIAINQINSFENDKNHLKLSKTMEAFPELFGPNEIQQIKILSETYQKTLDICNGTSKSRKEFDILASRKKELEKQVMAFPLTWTLRGTVEEKSESLDGILISKAYLEGNNIGECILKTSQPLEKETQIELSVKEEEQTSVELPGNKYATYRIFAEDYSANKRDNLNKQIIEINDMLKSLENILGNENSQLETNKLLLQANLEALKKNIYMKAQKYEL